MLLFNHIGLEGFLGSIVSSIFGFSISVIIGLVGLKVLDKDIHYGKLFCWFIKSMTCGLCMLIPLLVLNRLSIFDSSTVSSSLIKIFVYFVIGAPIYLVLSYKSGLLYELLGKETVNKILRKISFGKLGNK